MHVTFPSGLTPGTVTVRYRTGGDANSSITSVLVVHRACSVFNSSNGRPPGGSIGYNIYYYEVCCQLE